MCRYVKMEESEVKPNSQIKVNVSIQCLLRKLQKKLILTKSSTLIFQLYNVEGTLQKILTGS